MIFTGYFDGILLKRAEIVWSALILLILHFLE